MTPREPATHEEQHTRIDTTVPPDVSVVEYCPYCDRPFPDERLRDIHVGEVHSEEMTNAEGDLFTEAKSAESDTLFVLHLGVIVALVVAFFAIAYLYAFILAG
ncbi:MAG: hypothetical protein ABEJ58_04445 [Halodesulfurarchaeum sp.]